MTGSPVFGLGTGFFMFVERRKRDGTMDESHTRSRLPDIRIILSFAPARNKTRRDP